MDHWVRNILSLADPNQTVFKTIFWLLTQLITEKRGHINRQISYAVVESPMAQGDRNTLTPWNGVAYRDFQHSLAYAGHTL